MNKNFKKGFDAAWALLPNGEVKETREKIMKILGVQTPGSFSLYKRGKLIPQADKAQEIINLFTEKGIYNVYE